METDLYVTEIQDVIDTLKDIKNKMDTEDGYSKEFIRGVHFICDLLVENYKETVKELNEDSGKTLH